jgi:hypothetical protein
MQHWQIDRQMDTTIHDKVFGHTQIFIDFSSQYKSLEFVGFLKGEYFIQNPHTKKTQQVSW